MSNKMRIAVLVAVIFLIGLNTASPMQSSSVSEKVASYFQILDFSSYKTKNHKKGGTKKIEGAIVIEKLPGAARIITGISMRIGLSDDSIPSDQMISELLNLNSVKLKDLEKFSDATVNEYINKLLNVNNALTDGSAKLEQTLVDVRSTRMIWKSIDNFNSLPKSLDPLKAVEKWDLSEFKSFKSKEIMALLKANPVDYDAIKSNLESLTQAIEKAPGLSDISPVMAVLENLNPFYSFVSMMELVNSYFSNFQLYPINETLTSNVNKLAGLKAATIMDINVMAEIVKSQVFHRWFKRSVSSGFVDGFRDLDKMVEDSVDPWTKRALGSEISFEGLKSLSKITPELKELDEKWKKDFKNKDWHLVERLLKIQTRTGSISDISDFEKVGSTVTECAFTSNTNLPNELRSMTSYFLKVQKTATAIKTILQLLTKENIDAMNNLSDNNSPGVIAKISRIIQTISSHASVLEDGKSLSSSGSHVDNFGKYVTNFSNEKMIAEYIKHLKCISAVTAKFDEVASTAKLLMDLRRIKKNARFGEKVKEISSSVAQSLTSIASIRKVVNEVKEDNNKEVNELLALKSLQKYAKPFGDAATVSMTMIAASKQKHDLMSISANGHVIEESLNLLKDSNFVSEFRSIWGDVQVTLQNLAAFLDALEAWETKTQNLKGTGLEVITPHIEELSKLADVNIVDGERLSAIEDLILKTTDATIKSKLMELKSNLEKVSELDLEFSQYKTSLVSMPETLSQILLVFQTETDEVPYDDSDDDDDMPQEKINFYIGVGCLLFILLVVGTIWCYRDYKCLIWDLKNRFYKPNGSVKTAREGGVPGGGPAKNTQSKRRADGREDRKKPTTESVLLPPPPPPPVSTSSNNPTTQKESSKQSTVEGKATKTTKSSVKTDTDTL